MEKAQVDTDMQNQITEILSVSQDDIVNYDLESQYFRKMMEQGRIDSGESSFTSRRLSSRRPS